MKKILLVLVAVLIAAEGFGQETADIGIWGGTSTYFGDMNGVSNLQSFNPNFGAYYRYNFNPRVGVRAMILAGQVRAEGEIEGFNHSFDKMVEDISLQAEINYLKYILGSKYDRFTSYVTVGIGLAYLPYKMDPAFIAMFNAEHNKGDFYVDEAEIAATLPFGMGFKFTLGRRLGLGIEYQMRKLLSDRVDDLDDPLAYINNKGQEVIYTSTLHNNDWIGYLGVHLTYKIYIGKNPCPVYEKSKKK
jgi:hypothetical protein